MSGRGTRDMAYAVHTDSCSYLLDEEGVCRWIVAPQGVVPTQLRQCIGAQFVASLDMNVEGGLVGDLRSDARALFVRHTEGRIVLLRTGEVHSVEDRRAPRSDADAGELPPAAATTSPSSGYGKRAGVPRQTARPRFGVVEHSGDGQTLTLTVNLPADWPKQTRQR